MRTARRQEEPAPAPGTPLSALGFDQTRAVAMPVVQDQDTRVAPHGQEARFHRFDKLQPLLKQPTRPRWASSPHRAESRPRSSACRGLGRARRAWSRAAASNGPGSAASESRSRRRGKRSQRPAGPCARRLVRALRAATTRCGSLRRSLTGKDGFPCAQPPVYLGVVLPGGKMPNPWECENYSDQVRMITTPLPRKGQRYARGARGPKRMRRNQRQKLSRNLLHPYCTHPNLREEAEGGIEPPNRGFADLGLTTWLPRR